ncbi:MAG: glycosyltransferase [Planctomycetes bacterium]|nr:glycosyltransferase [Planctomycetota bacterium]
MVENRNKKNEPLVSILIATHNRRRYLPVALGSAINQDYKNIEIFVINDGGEDVTDVIESFNDERVIFINRKENRGLPFTLNQALRQVKGKYICYLGDDDLFYPNHVSTLLGVLEGQNEYQAAYSDLYKTYCRIEPDGTRQVLSKVVEISRDFDRFFMLYFNHSLHVSLMHRTDLLKKTGLYNENLNVLIDWDMTRRLVFFTDFYHVCKITGEFYSPVGDSDRISVQRRKDKREYLRNVMTIRTTRPAKPWPKIDDMSIIFTAKKLNKETGVTIGSIWRETFYPYKFYMPISQDNFNRLNTEMPNIVPVFVGQFASQTEHVDAALARCEGKYIAVVPDGFPIEHGWVEESLYALMNSSAGKEAFRLKSATDELCAMVLKKEDLLLARKSFPHLSLWQSIESAGITLREPTFEELPFQFDHLLQHGQSAQKDGNWLRAAKIFEYIAENHRNELWMRKMAAESFFKAGDRKNAAQISSEINQLTPTVNTLLFEAKVKREEKEFEPAIELLKQAEQILEGK